MDKGKSLISIFAENLSKELKYNNKTQRELADVLGVHETTVSCWILSKSYPRVHQLQQISDYLGVRPVFLTEEQPSTNYTVETWNGAYFELVASTSDEREVQDLSIYDFQTEKMKIKTWKGSKVVHVREINKATQF